MTDSTRDGWGPCPRGAFARLTTVLAARHARQVWLTRLGIAVGTLLAGAACWQTAAAIADWQGGGWDRPAHQCSPCTAPVTAGDCTK